MPNTSNLFVTQLAPELSQRLKEDLVNQGFTLSTPPHTLFLAKKKELTCTLYTSGKLVIQGKKAAEFVTYYLEPEILQTFTFGYETATLNTEPRIGIDESGKGDFFGPLCIGGVYAAGEGLAALSKLGVKDSKKLSDASVLKIAEKIRKEYPYHLVRIGPERYNELIEKFGNLNLLLGWGHATAIDALIEKTGCNHVIIDQFAAEHVVEQALKKKKKEVVLTQRTKAEEDLVVAAASIIARADFLNGLHFLGTKWGIPLPKGASKEVIEVGKKIVAAHGEKALRQVCKVHFVTFSKIINASTL